jgi:hypothetical protein
VRREHRRLDGEQRSHRAGTFDRGERHDAVVQRAAEIGAQPRAADDGRGFARDEELGDERAARLVGDHVVARHAREALERAHARVAVEREAPVVAEDAPAERREQRRVVVGDVRFVDEREDAGSELRVLELVERARRLGEQVGVHVERDALRRERHAEFADGLQRALVVRGRVDEVLGHRADDLALFVRAQARVGVDEDVGTVAARRSGFELREVSLERNGEELDADAGVIVLERARDGLDRALLVAAVRVPHDDGARVEVLARRAQRDEREQHERQRALQHGHTPSERPVSASNRCSLDGSIASGTRSPARIFCARSASRRTTIVGPAWRAQPCT